jgi:hypothetical protein
MKVMEKTHIKKENKVCLTIEIAAVILHGEEVVLACSTLVTLLTLLRPSSLKIKHVMLERQLLVALSSPYIIK